MTTVAIPVEAASLDGDLIIPKGAVGCVIFAHGSGSSRHSPRNRAVASRLQEEGLATLLLDLLTADEEEAERVTRHHRFDIELLASRLGAATAFVAGDAATVKLRVGYFGASTGAAAALVAAAQPENVIGAVVSRGGRPDLAGSALSIVRTPTLLIVGAADPHVLELNRLARAQMHAAHTELEVVPRAGHLFAEHGTLDQVADLAAEWFQRYLGAAPTP